MEANLKAGEFRIRKVRLEQHGFAYDTFELTGNLAGERVRRRFKTRAEALGEKSRLEVASANADGAIKNVTPRLTSAQFIEPAIELRDSVVYILFHGPNRDPMRARWPPTMIGSGIPGKTMSEKHRQAGQLE